MDKEKLNRHDLVFISLEGKNKICNELLDKYPENIKPLIYEIFNRDEDIPGFVRRSERIYGKEALGFIHYRRINGNRIRIPAFIEYKDIIMVMTPYEIMQRKAFKFNKTSKCIRAIIDLYILAISMELQIGVIGSGALELVTGINYTDDASDIDMLLKPTRYDKLLEFYRIAKDNYGSINMDFELDLPNGYGVKLPELFMKTQTLLGKSINDVRLLNRNEVLKYLI